MESPVDCSIFPTIKEDDDCFPKNTSYYSGTDSDEDADPVDMETTCPGLMFTKEEEEKITLKWENEYDRLWGGYTKLCNAFLCSEDEDKDPSTLPPSPLILLPKTTESCIKRGYCYHREHMTNDTNPTSNTLGYRKPHDMLQVLSLRLSHTESRPISVYGIFAVRDDLEPLRNYIFNRTRDDPIVIDEDSFALPLCSPCRGMYVLQRLLLEIDLWMKNEGDRSTDEQLLSGYVEIELRSSFDEKLTGRINCDRCKLDMKYIFPTQSVAVIIEVTALADNPNHLRFIAFSSCFDEIILFKGKGVVKGELIRHVVAVKAEEKLGVRLELGNSVFEWMFQDGVCSPPDDFITNLFHVRVFCSPNNLAPRRMDYFDWEEKCRIYKKKI